VPGGHVVLSYNTLILKVIRPVNPTLVLGIGRSYDQGRTDNRTLEKVNAVLRQHLRENIRWQSRTSGDREFIFSGPDRQDNLGR